MRYEYRWRHFDRRQLHISADISPTELRTSQAEFGLSHTLIHLVLPELRFGASYRAADEKYSADQQMAAARRQWELDNEARRKERLEGIWRGGFLLKGNVLEPDFPRLHQLNIRRTLPVARALLGVVQIPPPAEGGIMSVALSFVQELTYLVPPDSRGKLFTGGLLLPLEVLAGGAGDCDRKCLLLACLRTGLGARRMVLLRGAGHMVIGVALKDRLGKITAMHEGRTYVMCEALSGVWRPGEVESDIAQGIQAGRLQVVRLVDPP